MPRTVDEPELCRRYAELSSMPSRSVANCTNSPTNISGTVQNELWSRAKNAWFNIGR